MNKVFAIDRDEELKRLVETAQPGERLELTVNGRVVANVVPEQPLIDPDKARATLERIAERSRQMTLGGMSVTDLVAEGRRS